jgi:hypothetical protein
MGQVNTFVPMKSQYIVPSDDDVRLRKQLLNVTLRNTLRKNGIPNDWIGGETMVIKLPTGEVKIELQLAVLCDEPRFLTYLTSLQAEFVRRLLAIEPGAEDWFCGFTWRLLNEPIFEAALPAADYWEMVIADRDMTARQKGAMKWDADSLRRHFHETTPGDLVELSDTPSHQRGVEDIRMPGRR